MLAVDDASMQSRALSWPRHAAQPRSPAVRPVGGDQTHATIACQWRHVQAAALANALQSLLKMSLVAAAGREVARTHVSHRRLESILQSYRWALDASLIWIRPQWRQWLCFSPACCQRLQRWRRALWGRRLPMAVLAAVAWRRSVCFCSGLAAGLAMGEVGRALPGPRLARIQARSHCPPRAPF